jgi:hypothetical protein
MKNLGAINNKNQLVPIIFWRTKITETAHLHLVIDREGGGPVAGVLKCLVLHESFDSKMPHYFPVVCRMR